MLFLETWLSWSVWDIVRGDIMFFFLFRNNYGRQWRINNDCWHNGQLFKPPATPHNGRTDNIISRNSDASMLNEFWLLIRLHKLKCQILILTSERIINQRFLRGKTSTGCQKRLDFSVSHSYGELSSVSPLLD